MDLGNRLSVSFSDYISNLHQSQCQNHPARRGFAEIFVSRNAARLPDEPGRRVQHDVERLLRAGLPLVDEGIRIAVAEGRLEPAPVLEARGARAAGRGREPGRENILAGLPELGHGRETLDRAESVIE